MEQGLKDAKDKYGDVSVEKEHASYRLRAAQAAIVARRLEGEAKEKLLTIDEIEMDVDLTTGEQELAKEEARKEHEVAMGYATRGREMADALAHLAKVAGHKDAIEVIAAKRRVADAEAAELAAEEKDSESDDQTESDHDSEYSEEEEEGGDKKTKKRKRGRKNDGTDGFVDEDLLKEENLKKNEEAQKVLDRDDTFCDTSQFKRLTLIVKALQNLSIFKGLELYEYVKLAERAAMDTEFIRTDCMVKKLAVTIVVQGRVNLRKNGVTLRKREPGENGGFGEDLLMNEDPVRTLDARASDRKDKKGSLVDNFSGAQVAYIDRDALRETLPNLYEAITNPANFHAAQLLSMLKDVKLFENMKPSEIQRMIAVFETMNFVHNEVIVKQNLRDNRGFLIIIKGKVRVMRDNGTGDGEEELVILKEGQHFGEQSLINDAPRNASCIAVGTTQCLQLSKKHFYRFMSSLKAKLQKENRQRQKLSKLRRTGGLTAHEQRLVDTLRKVSVFQDMETETLIEMVHTFEKREYKTRAYLLKQGEVDKNGFFLLTEGKVGVFVNRVRVALLSPPNFFGEQALIHDNPRNASIVAVGRVSCLMLPRDKFKSLMNAEILHKMDRESERRANKVNESVKTALDVAERYLDDYETKPDTKLQAVRDAVNMLKKALGISRDVMLDFMLMVKCNSALARGYAHMGEEDAAKKAMDDGMKAMKKRGLKDHPKEEIEFRSVAGYVWGLFGNIRMAEIQMNKAIEVCINIKDKPAELQCLSYLRDIYNDNGITGSVVEITKRFIKEGYVGGKARVRRVKDAVEASSLNFIRPATIATYSKMSIEALEWVLKYRVGQDTNMRQQEKIFKKSRRERIKIRQGETIPPPQTETPFSKGSRTISALQKARETALQLAKDGMEEEKIVQLLGNAYRPVTRSKSSHRRKNKIKKEDDDDDDCVDEETRMINQEEEERRLQLKKANLWECSKCETTNPNEKLTCKKCGESKPALIVMPKGGRENHSKIVAAEIEAAKNYEIRAREIAEKEAMAEAEAKALGSGIVKYDKEGNIRISSSKKAERERKAHMRLRKREYLINQILAFDNTIGFQERMAIAYHKHEVKSFGVNRWEGRSASALQKIVKL
eukprot:g5221.t1